MLEFIVNVVVGLRRNGKWLVIERGRHLTNAPGTLAIPGGKVEDPAPGHHVLETTARRELREEVGLDLDGVPLRYAYSVFFVSDSGSPVVNVIFAAELADDREPVVAAPDEVESVGWWTLDEVFAHPKCPEWTRDDLTAAAKALDG